MFKLFSATVLAASLVASPVHARSKHHHRTHHRHHSVNVQSIATAIAHREGVNPALVHAIINVESTGRCNASSSAGARGAMQVKGATARSVGVYGNLHDCGTGILAGVRYYKVALRANHGNVCAALSSYNTGVGITGRCSGYGRKVLSRMGRVRYAYAR